MSLANEADNERQSRRQQVDAQWAKYFHPRRKRSNEKSRAASTDFARLDIADWLADQKVGDTSHVKVVVPEQRQPHSATIGDRRQPESSDQPTSSLGDTPEPYESQLGQAKSGDESENRSQSEPQSERSKGGEPDYVSPYPSADQVMTCAEPGESISVRVKSVGPEDHSGAESQPEHSERSEPNDVPLSTVKQVEIFAKAMTSTWPEIAAELGDTKSARDIKRELAYHGWCDLFIGLVRVIETSRHALGKIQEAAKEAVKRAILRSSMDAKRPHVTNDVVDVVVDRIWQAFKGAMVGQVPLLSIITREEALRSLRILAVFTCPAPEKHKEVREHALKPLGDDARRIITEQTKARLAKLFDEWATGD